MAYLPTEQHAERPARDQRYDVAAARSPPAGGIHLEPPARGVLRVLQHDEGCRPQVSCDGQNHFTCAPGDTITISKKAQKLRLIHPLDHNYYEVCRTKLGWGSKLGGGGD